MDCERIHTLHTRELYQYEALKAQVEKLEKLIEYCGIRSPTKGVAKKLFRRNYGTQSSKVLLIMEER